MSELEFPTINGRAVSWARIGLKIGGTAVSAATALRGFTKINYKSTVERGKVKGAGRELTAYTDGNLTHESSVEWIFETFDHIQQEFGEGFMDKGIVLSTSFKLGTNVVRTVEITAVGMKETGGDFSEGVDGLVMPMPLDVLRILYDGKSPIVTTTL